MRHAKSSWDDPRLADHDRPLNGRGRRALEPLAAHIEQAGVRPHVVLCSSARRAVETLDGVRAALGPQADVRIDKGLYGADVPELVARLRQSSAETTAVMVIAHNPGLQDLVLHLAGDGDEQARATARTKFPTGALATLDLGDAGWSELAPGCGYLVSVFTVTRSRTGE